MANWRESAERIFGSGSANNSNTVSIPKTTATNTTTSGTNNSGSWRDSAQNILDSVGYVPQKQRKYELKLNDGTSFGTVSYDAYNAIISNNLDNYMPKSQEEKAVLDTYKKYAKEQEEKQEPQQKTSTEKDGFFSWLGKQAMSGLGQFNKGVAATLDFVLPTEFLGKYDFVSKLNDYYDNENTSFATEAQQSSASRGKGWQIAGELVSGSVAALPNAVLAYMTAGASLGATGATTLANGATIATAGTTTSALKQVVNTMMKNPSYWTSVMRTLGTDYEEAKERGANDLVASATAIITTALNAGIEVGSGIEKLPSNLKTGGKNAVFKWVKSALEEGGEEVVQSITTNAIAKLMYDHDAPVISTTAENAVINPSKLAKEFALGVGVGGILGGGQSAISSAVNAKNIKNTGKYFKNAGVEAIQSIVDTGLESPKDTEAYKLAEKAQQKLNKSGNLSDYEIGKLYYANVAQLEAEELSAKTSPITTTEENSVTESTTVDPAAELTETVKSAQQEVVETETPSATISVGDVYNDTKSGSTVTVLERDENNTTVQVDTGNGVRTQKMANNVADNFVTSGQLAKVGSVEGTKEATVPTETSDVTSTTKNINLKRVGNFYEAYGKEAQMLAEELELETKRAMVNGVETDVLRLPADLTQKLTSAISDDFNLVLSDNPISSDVQNANVTDETTTTDEVTPSAEENTTEGEIAVVVDALNDTLLPKAREEILKIAEENSIKNGIEEFAKRIKIEYEKKGNIERFSGYFTDNGKKVISAIKSTMDATTTDGTSVAISNVVDTISETLTPQAKESMQDGDYNSMAETIMEVYQATGSLEAFESFFVDGGKKVEATIKGETDNVDVANDTTTTSEKETVAEVLKNESESDTIESKSETTPVESEDNGNESVREDLLHGNGKRGNDGSTRKQAERLLSFGRKNQGRDATERQDFTRELIERGQVKETTIANCKTTLINPEAYNDDMKSMVEEAKRKGIELRFVAGTMDSVIELDDGRKITKRFRGIQLSPAKILVQYDNAKSPQMIAKHEIIHAKWNTPEIQAIKDTILGSLTAEDKQDILSQERYQHYMEAYKNDKDAVWQEFICDVMSGDTYYYADYIDTVNDYWYGNEELDSYNVAEYSESIDAGGKSAESKYDLSDEGGEHDEKRNNSRGISGISEKSGNKRGRNTSNKRDVPLGQTETLPQKTDNPQYRAGRQGKRSGLGHLVRGVESSKGLGKSGDGQSTENRRFQQAIDNNDSATANDMLNKKAVANGYVPVKVYKGTQSDKVRTVFDKGNAIWVTTDHNYAYRYSSEYSGKDNVKSAQLHTEPNSNVYELYAKYGNVLELGDIEQEINTLEEAEAFAKKVGITISEFYQCRNEGREHGTDAIWAITNTKRFAELARNNGYDSLHASERNGTETYGILYPENVKSSKLETYDDKGNLIPLSERFDKTNNDIRYDIDDDFSQIQEKQVEIQRLTNQIRELEKSDEFDRVMNEFSKAVADNNVDKGTEIYNKWLKDSGYSKLREKRDKLQEEVNEWNKAWKESYETKELEAEKKAIEKSGLSEADYFRKQAVKEFGYTPYFYDAGYITPNGKMLNFSGEKGQHFGSRGQDHRAIGIVYANVDGGEAMVKFMGEGNIRIMAESPGIDISSLVEPTKEQYATIRKFVREYADKEYFNIDITNVDGQTIGNYEYEGRLSAERVVNDIKYFFENGTTREASSIAQFRYDIDDADNEYMEAVESGDTETVAKMIEDAAEKSFPNSKVRGDDGKLKLVYHGRVSDFNVFDRSFANAEGDFGKGYYFTSNEYDVDANYANEEGPDLKNKISKLAERLEWEDEYADLSYDEREEIARQRLITSEPSVITAYLNMENPVYITPDEKGTFLDYTEEYDEEYDEYGEPEGLLIDFIEALKNNSYDYAYHDVDFDFLYEYAWDNGGMYASDAVKIIKERVLDELSDENGDIATNEVIRLAFEEIGFDGIIDTSVYYKFRNMNGVDSGTTHYIVFNSEQIKSADLTTYDDKGNVIPLSERFNENNKDIRYDVDDGSQLKTQKKIENIAKEINSHEELISLTKQNTKEFVDKIKENKSLQKRLDNAKRQASLSPKPIINIAKVGQVTKDVLKEMESTLKATDLKDEIISIYTEYFDSMKKASGVESKVQEANDNMMNRFATLAVDIADSAVAYAESEGYMLLKSYLKDVRIKVPDHAKAEAHYAEFRKSHMGTFNLTNDGMDIDMVYQELCDMFPGMFDVEVSNAVDQLYAIADKVETLKPYAYNPHIEYMQDAIDHIVYRFASEVDGIAANPKTKAQKIAEKGAYDKEMALEKERASFERKLDKHKKNSENIINKLQKKIDDANYVRYWEKRLSKDEKTQAVNKVRERQKVAVLKTKIRNIVSSMKKKLDKNEKVGGYPRELVKTVADVCSALDFHTDRTGKGGTPTKVSLKLDALKMEYDALKNNENYDFSSEYSEELSGSIGELHKLVKDKRVIDLTANELSQLKDILSEIDHRLSNAMKQIGIASAKANAEIGSEIIDSLKSRSDAIKSDRTQLLKEMEIAKNRGMAFVINPHRINKMIAGYDTNSAWWQIYDGINRGSRKASKFAMDATKPFDELVEGGGNEIAFYDYRTKGIKTGIKYIDGSEVEVPKSIICELVMMWERKQGRTHLETGGAKIPDMELYNKGKTSVAITDAGKRTNPITQADIDRLRTLLDSYDLAWIDKAHHLFNKVSKEAINSTSMELLGRELAKTENYIRMYVDQDFIRREIDGKKEDATLESSGSLKETVPNAKQPIVLRGLHENVYDNIDFSSKYYGLAIPIRNFNKIYNIVIREGDSRNSVKELIGQKLGSAVRTNVVEQLIRDLQAPRPRNVEPFGSVRGKWLGATFWGNIRSALKQTTSYWTASSILGEDSLVKGLTAYATHSKQTKAEINKHSGTLYKRSQGLSTTELGDRANRKRLAGASNKVTKFINEKAPVLRKVPEWIRPSNWLQSMDVAVSSALWDACKVEISKTMDVSDEGYMQAVTDLYERVIEETQSNYDVAHRPEALKNKSAVVQAVTMFQTDSLQQTGILIDAFNDYKIKSELYKKNKSSANENAKKEAQKGLSKAIRSRVYSSLWLVFATHVGNMILRKFKPYVDEEEKEITPSSFAKQSLLMLCDDMLGVCLPVVGQLLTKVADTWSEGYDFVTEPTFDVLEDFIKDTNKIWDAMTDYDDEVSWKERAVNTKNAFIEAIPSISNMTGIPAKNISDWLTAIKGYVGDIKEGKFAHDISEYGSSKSFYSYGDLATHIISGNKEKQKKILDYNEENGKEFSQGSLTKEIKSAYVQALVDSPEKARNIKRNLILDYDYSEESIDGWASTVYLDNIVPNKKLSDKTMSNPEYAAEIKTALQDARAWDKEDVEKSAKSRYKKVYKEGKEDEINALRDALLNANVVSKSSLTKWEREADKETKEANKELEKTKRKYKE